MKINTCIAIAAIFLAFVVIQCTPDEMPITEVPCDIIEEINTGISGFGIFEPGDTEYGYAEGMKINTHWQAGAFHRHEETGSYTLYLQTVRKNGQGQDMPAEMLTIRNIQEVNMPACFDLNEQHGSVTLIADYKTWTVSGQAIDYTLDPTSINALYIGNLNFTDSILEGSFRATFNTTNQVLPEFPSGVRFFDVDIYSRMKPDILPCVAYEPITAVDTGFYVFYKGEQLNGSVTGVKINETWEASPFLIALSDTFTSLVLINYWPVWDSSLVAEYVHFHIPHKFDFPMCYELTDARDDPERLYGRYSVRDHDVVISWYILDTTTENRFEIIHFDNEKSELIANFKASFIAHNPIPPYIPEHVRIFNVEIRVGVD